MSIGGIRVSRRSLPGASCLCSLDAVCVYRKDGACDEPRINKANSDAACHKISNRLMLGLLVPCHPKGIDENG